MALVEPLLNAIERARDKRTSNVLPFMYGGDALGQSTASLDRLADAPLMAIV